MIDELLDSLLLQRLPSYEGLAAVLTDLARGAEDLEAVLHSFKSSFHLRVGVRDILGKSTITETHQTLSNIAEVCVAEIARQEFARLTEKYGQPEFERQGTVFPCEFVMLAMGKLGGQEPNYHSDLDVIFLYQQEGQTRLPRRSSGASTSNQHFFSELGQRVMKIVNRLGPHGRLYEMDTRIRPTGVTGVLTVPLGEFVRYFESGQAQLWERQSLCKARAIYGSQLAREETMHACQRLLRQTRWSPECARTLRDARIELEQTASPSNLKRGPGGTMDVEFIVQMLQLKHAAATPDVLRPNTLEAIDELHRTGSLSGEDAAQLSQSYQFLRGVESRLRLLDTSDRHDLPQDQGVLAALAYLLEYDGPVALEKACKEVTAQNRDMFNRQFAAEVDGRS